MVRITISLVSLLALVGCGRYVAPLKDLEAKSDKQPYSYNPVFENKGDVNVKGGGNRGATAVRGVANLTQETYYGSDNALVADAQAIFSQYGQFVSALYSTTIEMQQYYDYFVNSFWPNFGGSQFPFWGGGNNSFRASDVVLTVATSAPKHYRIDIDAPTYYGYTSSNSPWGRQTSYITAWDVTGNSLVAKLRVIPGSTITLTAAPSVLTDTSASATLNVTAVVTNVVTANNAGAAAPQTVTRNLSSLIAKNVTYGAGYIGQVRREIVQVGDVRMTARGIANNLNGQQYCYFRQFCFGVR